MATGIASAQAARNTPALVVPTEGGAAWTHEERAALRSRMDALFATSAAVRGAHVGLYAVDVRDGSLLYARQGDDEFMPASTLKLVVGSVALAKLGLGFRFHTDAFAADALRGEESLVLRGGGDPFLQESDLEALAAAVAARGHAVTPYVDASYFDDERYPRGWVWDDLPFSYAPVVSALSFQENMVHLTVDAGPAVGDLATVTASVLGPIRRVPVEGCPATADVIVIPRATTGARGSESTVDVMRARGGCIVVVGKVPLGGTDTADAAVPSPVLFAYRALVDSLRARNVLAGQMDVIAGPWPDEHPYRGDPQGQRATIWSHDSEPMPKLLADLWLPSDNLLAELLLKSLGVAHAGVPGTTENGVALETEWLRSIGVDPASVTLSDGSGLSIYDRITPRDLVAVLRTDWSGPDRGLVLGALPVAGVRGTLEDSFAQAPLAGRLFAKTGSMTHVRALAGYLATPSRGTVAFALMVDDWNGAAPPLDGFREAALRTLLGS